MVEAEVVPVSASSTSHNSPHATEHAGVSPPMKLPPQETMQALVQMLQAIYTLPTEMVQLRKKLDQAEAELETLFTMTNKHYIEATLLRPYREAQARYRERDKQDQLARRKQIVTNTLQLLSGTLTLPLCLRLIGYLKQQADSFQTSASLDNANVIREIQSDRLPWTFLRARRQFIDKFIHSSLEQARRKLEAAKSVDIGLRDEMEALMEIMREAIFPIVIQYRAIFDDPIPLSLQLVALVGWFVGEMRGRISHASVQVLASIWNQLVLVNRSFSSVLADMIPFLLPIFHRRIIGLTRRSISAAVLQVSSKLFDEKFRLRAITPTSSISENDDNHGSNGTNSASDINDPSVRRRNPLLAYPILVLLMNAAIEGLNQLRFFADPALKRPVKQMFLEELAKVEACFSSLQADPKFTQFHNVYNHELKHQLLAHIDNLFLVNDN